MNPGPGHFPPLKKEDIMSENRSALNLMKAPLILAAAVVIVRIVLEQLGAPQWLNNIFGVAWLHILVPIWFGLKIAEGGSAQPFKDLFKTTALYAIFVRLMVWPTYSLAYLFGWSAPRFSVPQGGVVGGDVSPLQGIVLIPLRNLAIWVISATIIGMITGGIALAVKKKRSTAGSA